MSEVSDFLNSLFSNEVILERMMVFLITQAHISSFRKITIFVLHLYDENILIAMIIFS